MELVIYPELHLCSLGAETMNEREYYTAYAEPLDGPRGWRSPAWPASSASG
ncbi:hypothetical protein ACFVTP_33960 [Streptomyces celluloflavus]|uniref:hypothetical protein n=1 Tax=Streptomyces celluloflavus TaxID=58344 RepID=UPI0036D7D41A